MKDEKEIGITKNHLGFVADEIESVLPPEWENIVIENDKGIKHLNYIKMNAILWGCVREQVSLSETYWSKMREQQQKIEWLESSVYELQEAVKELMKPKPKAKAKPKKKSKDKSDSED